MGLSLSSRVFSRPVPSGFPPRRTQATSEITSGGVPAGQHEWKLTRGLPVASKDGYGGMAGLGVPEAVGPGAGGFLGPGTQPCLKSCGFLPSRETTSLHLPGLPEGSGAGWVPGSGVTQSVASAAAPVTSVCLLKPDSLRTPHLGFTVSPVSFQEGQSLQKIARCPRKCRCPWDLTCLVLRVIWLGMKGVGRLRGP